MHVERPGPSKKMWVRRKSDAGSKGGLDDGVERKESKFLDHSAVRTVTVTHSVRPSGVPKSLGDVLASSELRYKFRVFLKERLSLESLMFYESIEMYEKIADIKWRKRAGEGLLTKFVIQEADLQVNISSHCRTKLLRVTKWEKNSFEEAKVEMYELLRTNFFAPFVAREFLNG
jgi:hypothetical protein